MHRQEQVGGDFPGVNASMSDACPIDKFTPLYVSAGMSARYLGLSLGRTLLYSALWSFLAEPLLRQWSPKLLPEARSGDTMHDIADAAAPALGWLALDYYLKKTPEVEHG